MRGGWERLKNMRIMNYESGIKGKRKWMFGDSKLVMEIGE